MSFTIDQTDVDAANDELSITAGTWQAGNASGSTTGTVNRDTREFTLQLHQDGGMAELIGEQPTTSQLSRLFIDTDGLFGLRGCSTVAVGVH